MRGPCRRDYIRSFHSSAVGHRPPARPNRWGYTGIFLGTQSRLVAFSGAVLGIVVLIGLMTFVSSLLVMWITRRVGHPGGIEGDPKNGLNQAS